MNNKIYQLARIAYYFNFKYVDKCDICGKAYGTFALKVFHNVKGKPYLKIINYEKNHQVYKLVDHILVCEKCKDLIPKGWFACRCKKEENIKIPKL